MLAWVLENTAVAALLALALVAGGRLLRARPALAHALWLVALAALLLPPIPLAPTPGGELRAGLRELVLGRGTAEEHGSAGAPHAPVDPLAVGVAGAPGPAAAVAPPEVRAVARPAARPWTTLAAALALAWLAGAIVVLARTAARVIPFARLVARAPRAPRALRREVEAVARRLGVRAPETRVVAGIASPSVWCLGRPRLLWPGNDGLALAPRARAALIAHELAHLARRDHWVSWLEVPAAALLWWNPLLWWIRGRIRHFAELACDAWAVRAYPADRRLFAEALIDLQARTLTAPVALQGLGATDAECRDFERRLDMIMQKRVSPRVSRGAAALAVLAAILSSPGLAGGKGGGNDGALAVVESRATSLKFARKARELLAAEDLDGARAALEEVLALDPANGWAHGRLGVLLVGSGETEAAKAHFRRQYELGDMRPTALYNLACACAKGGDPEGALDHVAAAVRHGFSDPAMMVQDPDLAALREDARFRAELERGRALVDLRGELATLAGGSDPERFLAVHAELAAIVTADGMLQAEHGHLAMKSGDRAAAALAFGRQAEAGYMVPNALYNRACARALAGEADGALADLAAAAEAGMHYAGIATDADLDSLRERAEFAALAERIRAPAEARMELRELVLASDPAAIPALEALAADVTSAPRERAWAGRELGRLHLAADRHAEAIASYEAAAALGVDVQRCAFGMAEVLADLGKRDKAFRHVQYAVDLGFDDPEALGALLETHELAAPADADALVERAAAMRDAIRERMKAAPGTEKASATRPASGTAKVVKDS